MANYQLNNREEARKWFDRAVQPPYEKRPSEELRRFQAEAEALIGLPITTNPSSQPAATVPAAAK